MAFEFSVLLKMQETKLSSRLVKIFISPVAIGLSCWFVNISFILPPKDFSFVFSPTGQGQTGFTKQYTLTDCESL